MTRLGCATSSLLLLHRAAASSTEHVSPSGSDNSGDGSATRPYATLPRAQAAAQAAAATAGDGDVTVAVAAGEYYVPEPLRFTAADSPRGGGRTTYRGPGPSAAAAEQATIFGGVPVPPSLWRPEEGGRVWRADVSALLPPNATRFFMLIEGDAAATLARLPKKGSGYLRDLGCRAEPIPGPAITCPAGALPAAVSDDVADLSLYCVLGNRSACR